MKYSAIKRDERLDNLFRSLYHDKHPDDILIANIRAKAERIRITSIIAPQLCFEELTQGEIASLILSQANSSKAISNETVLPKKIRDDDKPSGLVTFSDFFKEEVLPKLFQYFPKDQHKPLRALVINKIEPEIPLKFNGLAYQLGEFFKRAKYNGLVICCSNTPLQEWICKYFVYQKKGQITVINPKTIIDILKNHEKEGKVKRHILTDILPYQSPESRRK